tara:strand:- start:4203 stop:4907 length:705 start_codon:yes stop_codon:yes gene_type:complete
MGAGKGSSSSSVQMTPEQTELLRAQTGALKDTFLPAYTKTISGADAMLRDLQPYQTKSALNAFDTFTDVGKKATTGAEAMITSGNKTLQALFDPDYEQGQIDAALQAGRESARESQLGQNAMYGASGGLGSSRMALADRNLSSLNAQRQATAAAGAQAQVQANRANAATSVMSAGQNLANTGLTATGNAITAAQSPMDLYSKYAAVVYGTPQASTTPNFAGTQSQKTSSKGFGF